MPMLGFCDRRPLLGRLGRWPLGSFSGVVVGEEFRRPAFQPEGLVPFVVVRAALVFGLGSASTHVISDLCIVPNGPSLTASPPGTVGDLRGSSPPTRNGTSPSVGRGPRSPPRQRTPERPRGQRKLPRAGSRSQIPNIGMVADAYSLRSSEIAPCGTSETFRVVDARDFGSIRYGVMRRV